MDTRTEQSRSRIKNALLELLKYERVDSVTMSSIAQLANVGRTTLYAHYPNVSSIFEEAVADFCAQLRPLGAHLRCGQDADVTDERKPFCIALREAGRYEALVRDPQFLPVFLRQYEALAADGTGDPDGVVNLFQLSGCYAAVMNTPKDADWSERQRVLDDFIRAGRRSQS